MEEKELSDIGEWGIIERIKGDFPHHPSEVLLGIGDDAAAVRVEGKVLLFSSDLLIEDIHFKTEYTPPFLLGRKAVAVNVSDIAAMGGVPRYLLLSLAAPQDLPFSFLTEFSAGLSAEAKEHNISLLGGDTSAGEKITIDILIIGETEEERIVKRAGAEPGDLIFVTGSLGDSGMGFTLLKAGFRMDKEGRVSSLGDLSDEDKRAASTLLSAHLAPKPEFPLGRILAEQGIPKAMLDISDGLAKDLRNLVRASKIGARIYEDKIPLSSPLIHFAKKFYQKPLDYALNGGEDYRLLFTAHPSKRKEIDELSAHLGVRITEIGEIMEGTAGIILMGKDGKERDIRGGYDHFEKR